MNEEPCIVTCKKTIEEQTQGCTAGAPIAQPALALGSDTNIIT
jgi:hypothetical protein